MFSKLKSQGTLVNKPLNLTTLNQNILYLTRQTDAILKRVDMLIDDYNLQKQANSYYEDKEQTSPQTDTDEQ